MRETSGYMSWSLAQRLSFNCNGSFYIKSLFFVCGFAAVDNRCCGSIVIPSGFTNAAYVEINIIFGTKEM